MTGAVFVLEENQLSSGWVVGSTPECCGIFAILVNYRQRRSQSSRSCQPENSVFTFLRKASVFLFSSLILVILDFSWVVFQRTYNSGNEVQMMFDDHHDAFETFCTLNINGSSGNVPSLVSGMTGNLSNLAPMLLPCVHLKAPDMFADQDKNTDALLKTLNISRVIMGCRYIEKRRAQQLHWRQTAVSVSRMSSEAWT